MSLAYSDLTNKNGIIQSLERVLFGDNSDTKISGNTLLLQQFTSRINQTIDRAFSIIFNAEGTWQFDDRNHADYPIITTAITENQREYSFTTDGNSNLILQIHRVMVANEEGVFRELKPVDQQSDTHVSPFWDGQNVTGKPTQYDKTANAVFLDPIPDYTRANSLKFFISREGNYFTTSDTTQMPGFAGIFHEYCVLRPAWQYAYENSLANVNALRDEMLRMEAEIKEYYAKRSKDEEYVMGSDPISYV